MSMPNNKTLCCTCNKPKITYSCKGCLQEFCSTHLSAHQETLNEELNGIIDNCNRLNEIMTQQNQNQSSLQEIDLWEVSSIEKIQQMAEECRKVIEETDIFMHHLRRNFHQLTNELTQVREENEFNEMNLNYLRDELRKMTEEFYNLAKVFREQDSSSFVNKISVETLQKTKHSKWKRYGYSVAGGNKQGNHLNQFAGPYKIVLDVDKNIYVVDYWNHRIVRWKPNAIEGEIVTNGSEDGNETKQLNCPTDVSVNEENHSVIIADRGNRRIVELLDQNYKVLFENIDCASLIMDNHGSFYISDCEKNEVRRWTIGDEQGMLVAGGNGCGDQLNQLHFPSFIFLDKQDCLYISDGQNHRVMKWQKHATEGTIVAGGNGNGNRLDQLSLPAGIFVDDWNRIYIADCGNHRVMRWCEGQKEGEIILGGNGCGKGSDQLHCPNDIAFDFDGNLYVADWKNNRIQRYDLVSDFIRERKVDNSLLSFIQKSV
ncbi:unnamed protein product [Adineta ricciae]|uniref:Uncharacterized protein n=1 Tax=Adineta ricciae TaxID=249248 RepID=A0A814K3F3_ADIRI|nr:unnamed protein product [Adineta ricciae]CAF1355010.1 unnamed protein product [Adineta ricciae]